MLGSNGSTLSCGPLWRERLVVDDEDEGEHDER